MAPAQRLMQVWCAQKPRPRERANDAYCQGRILSRVRVDQIAAILACLSSKRQTHRKPIALGKAASVWLPSLASVLACPALAGSLHAQDSAVVSAQRANVRTKPSASAQVVTTFQRGVRVLLVQEQNGWVNLRRDAVEGWMRADLLSRIVPAPVVVQKAVIARDTTATVGLPSDRDSAKATTGTSDHSVVRSDWNYKDPAQARRYAMYLPGGGHLYTGETLKGAGILVGSVVTLYSGIGRVARPDCGQGFLVVQYVKCAPVHTAVMVGAFVYGIVDARGSAERANRRSSVGPTARLSVTPLSFAIGSHEVAYGAVVTLRW